MSESDTYLNNNPLHVNTEPVNGSYIMLDNEKYYKISNYDQMRPFFISLVSHSDHWLFLSSNGGITAGRKDENQALFPYYTDDKILKNAENTGSKSIFRVIKNNRTFLWEPFSCLYEGVYPIKRNIYKNFYGNKIFFEEINKELNLTFRYKWQLSEKYGFIKSSELENLNSKQVTVEIIDGIQNVLPYGVSASLQNNTSNLVNAYKKNELVSIVNLGIFSLSSMIIDKAEPSEALKATTVWSTGIKSTHILLSDLQINNFRKGQKIKTETDIRAEPGSYFIKSRINLNKKQTCQWHIVAEVNQDHAKIFKLIENLKTKPDNIIQSLKDDIKKGMNSLKKLVCMSDGLQRSDDEMSVGRHYSNVLFNIMRGGIFQDQYCIDKKDFIKHVVAANKQIKNECRDFFSQIGRAHV